MVTNQFSPWTVREAKSKLSEVLRLAREQGPQAIGAADKRCLVVSQEDWDAHRAPLEASNPTFGQWLVLNAPTVGDIELPPRSDSRREVPFSE